MPQVCLSLYLYVVCNSQSQRLSCRDVRYHITGYILLDCDQDLWWSPGFVQSCLTLISYQLWSVWPWERSDGGQLRAQYRCLSVIRSGSFLLQRGSLLKPGKENSCPLPPTLGPFTSDGSWLIYIVGSCDGAPSLPSFVLPSSPHHKQSSWQHCSN